MVFAKYNYNAYNAVTGRALSRALDSLSMSSALTISLGALEWRADGLNSPYLTHQNITLSIRDEPLPHRLMLITNGNHTVAVAPRVYNARPAAPAGHEWREAVGLAAPWFGVAGRVAALVPGLAAEVRALLADLGGTPLVTAAVLLREVMAWEPDGSPVYAELPAEDAPPAGIQEAAFSPDDEPPSPVEDAA